ncbi:radical SAM protein [Kitasatospora sp. NBC_01266]|uniref:radical SAM protein n=1 Tax=Kitasatospora sp. NBC_01266 TaxID=2903572 RepID=UPI002E3136AD|nr:radical SAM protein [Kitasatospora sp. NBC_01266]
MTAVLEPPIADIQHIPHVIELEITGKCQLECTHCFADSGPTGTHGVMTQVDWCGLIDQAAELGITTVQLIGGEPTAYPGWSTLVDHALNAGRKVEVFSNLYHVSAKGWAIFERPGVSLATSYYSPNPGEHDRVTKVAGSHERTRANIREAVRRDIPIRAGVVGINDGQLERLAVAELRELGVQRITLDYQRGVGRAAKVAPDVSVLCGNCGRGRLAIMPDGAVSPCVLGRFMRPFNIRQTTLREVLCSPEWAKVIATIPPRRGTGLDGARAACPPDDSNDCSPASTEACDPAYFVPGEGAPLAVSARTYACPPDDSNDCSPASTEACDPAY